MKTNTQNSGAEPLIKSNNHFPVIGIGASAGGLDAFKRLLKAIPADSGMAYVLVQHLHPGHDSMLATLLQKVTSIPVVEITNNIKILPDHIYTIPSNKILIAKNSKLELSPRLENKHEKYLTIDLFFSSLAEVYQNHAIGVVLSGIASDGTQGLKAIKESGGITFAQDETTAAYDGMPHSAVLAGVVDYILPPEDIPQKILELAKIKFVNNDAKRILPKTDDDVITEILSLVHIHKGVDFTSYKHSTISRRILRRMALNKMEHPAEYLAYIHKNLKELDVLFKDLLIPVTSFFRDSKSYDNLCQTILPHIFRNKSSETIITEPVRIWVAGCSTGQEAYTIAICIKEFLGHQTRKVQIFASDINEAAVVKARIGCYTKADVADLSPERVKAFFTKCKGGFQLVKEVRDMCVFAVHNFLKDPPFSNIDFISCRNVLIYMNPDLQKKALTTFHYALKKEGFLMLGRSETTSSVPGLFASDVKHNKIFSRKDVPGKFIHTPMPRAELKQPVTGFNRNEQRTYSNNFQKAADDILLSKFTPAGVVVNEAMDIVHFRGSTSPYLEQTQGKPTHNLLKMAKHDLSFELQSILQMVKREKSSVKKENISFRRIDGLYTISIEAIPLPNTAEPHYLILFHDEQVKSKIPAVKGRKPKSKLTNEEKDLRIEQLEKELMQFHKDARTIAEAHRLANEELQNANEELLTSSEELQTLGEELETGKEELQSTNEELTVVNQELMTMNEQVISARDYAENIISTLRQPLLVLDKDLRVKTTNASFCSTFQVNEQETEGTLIYDLGNKQWNIPALRKLLENILPGRMKFNDFEIKHHFPNIGDRTMLLNARELKATSGDERLILLSIEDITDRKEASKKVEESEELFRFIAEVMPQKVWTANAEGQRTYFNGQWVEYTGLSMEELGNDGWKKIIHPDDLSRTEKIWQIAIDTKSDFEVEDRKRNREGQYLWHLSRATPFKSESGTIIMWVGTNTEIEKQKTYSVELEKAVVVRTAELQKAIEELQQSENQIKTIFEAAPDGVIAIDHHGIIINWNTEAENIFGWEKHEVLGKPFAEMVISKSYREQLKRTLMKLLKMGGADAVNKPIEMKGLRKDKTEIPVELKISVSQINHVNPIFIGFARNIADRKFSESQLKNKAAQIAEKVIELQRANKELEAFTYVSSHDLQEPLRKIQTFAGRILEGEHQHLSEKGKDMFRRMQEAGQRMQALIQDLLAFSRVNSTERIFEKANLNEIIEQVKREFKEIIEEKKATIEVSEMCKANIIRFQFRQLMQNLISNSLKFSRSDTPPRIIIKDEMAKGIELNHPKLIAEKDYCHITFMDNGIGFEPEFSEKVFEVFQKLHTRDEFAGTGIGLAIVKKIVENHEGIITATSELTKGTKFDIYIPA